MSEAIEDYVKAIYAIQSRDGAAVTTTALAERLGVTPGSASGMIKKLAEIELVVHVPYKGVTLSPPGEKLALEVLRHHRLLEAFFTQVLEMPWDRIHAEAEVLEHYISEDLEQLIAGKLGDPVLDPHGDPIPDCALTMPKDDTSSLADLEPGEGGIFTRVSDRDPEILRYLAEQKIVPGVELSVEDKQPFGGPLFVRVGGAQRVLGRALARSIRIRRSRPAKRVAREAGELVL